MSEWSAGMSAAVARRSVNAEAVCVVESAAGLGPMAPVISAPYQSQRRQTTCLLRRARGARAARCQYSEQNGHEKQSRNIAEHVAMLGGRLQRLHGHNRGVHHARKYREPNQAEVAQRIAGGEQEKDSERGIDAHD